MILLEEFLKKVFGYGDEMSPMVWIYDGCDAINPNDKEDNLLAVYKSCFVPGETFSEEFLEKRVKKIYKSPDGLAVCVEDKDEEYPETNADRIRAMSDEQLAEFLCKIRSCDSDGHPCDGCTAEKYCQPGHIGMLDYLKKPTGEELE